MNVTIFGWDCTHANRFALERRIHKALGKHRIWGTKEHFRLFDHATGEYMLASYRKVCYIP